MVDGMICCSLVGGSVGICCASFLWQANWLARDSCPL